MTMDHCRRRAKWLIDAVAPYEQTRTFHSHAVAHQQKSILTTQTQTHAQTPAVSMTMTATTDKRHARDEIERMLTRLPIGAAISASDIRHCHSAAVAALQLPPALAAMSAMTDDREFQVALNGEWRQLAAKAAKLTMKPLATGTQVRPPFPALMQFDRHAKLQADVAPPAAAAAAAANSSGHNAARQQQQQDQHQPVPVTADGFAHPHPQHSGDRCGHNVSPGAESVFDTPPEFHGLPHDTPSPL